MTERTKSEFILGIGRALRFLREQRGRKQKDVAVAAGLGGSRLSNIESERRRPTLETVGRILAALECDLHDLHNALALVQGQYHKLCEKRVGTQEPDLRRETSPCSSGPPKGKGKGGR